MSDVDKKTKKRSGYLFIAAGCCFLVAGTNQPAFYGGGVMFLVIGISYLGRSK